MPLCGARFAPLRRVRSCFAPTAHCDCIVLSGKTHDLAWLAKQPGVAEVVGVEFVRQALDEFAAEHKELPLKKRVVTSSNLPVLLSACQG